MPVETNYSSSGADETRAVGNPGGSIQEAMEASRNRLASAYTTVQERSSAMLHDAEGFINLLGLPAAVRSQIRQNEEKIVGSGGAATSKVIKNEYETVARQV